MKRPELPVRPTASPVDEATPSPTRHAFAAWEAHGVPALPDDFADRVVCEATADGLAPAFAAWEAHGVPNLPDDFADRVACEALGTGLAPAFAAWEAHGVPNLPDDFADRVAARVEAAKVTALPARRTASASGRRWLWPALAAAAALVLSVAARNVPDEPLRTAPAVATVQPPVEVPARPAPAPATPVAPEDEPVVVGAEGTEGGAEVTHMDVLGARSYAVLQVPGVAPGTTTTVVWIDDKPEPGPSETVLQ